MAIVFVSHFLDQVYAVADRMTVLRNGKRVGEWPTAELTPGRARLEDARPRGRDARGARGAADAVRRRARGRATPVIRARGRGPQRARSRRSTSTIHPGEVVGLAGLLGSGRTEVARLMFGADHADEGQVGRRHGAGQEPARGDGRGDRVLPREPQDRGAGPGADDPREHRARDAGGARLDEADPAQAPGRAGREVDQGARHPARRSPSRSSGRSAAATSRRCCWRAG